MKTKVLNIFLILGLVFSLAAAPLTTSPASMASAKAPVLWFNADGMRPDLMAGYAMAGKMPTYAKLMLKGAWGDNGMVQAFPPNTGVGWYTLATGTWPGEHGSMNNTFFRGGDNFANSTSFSASGILQADNIAAAAERAGKKVAIVGWVGGANLGVNGPDFDYVSYFSGRGIADYPDNPTDQANAASFGLTYQVPSVADASGWVNVPAGDPAAPAKESQYTINTSFAAQNPTRVYDLYIYDSKVDGTAAYDTVLLVPMGKDGSRTAVKLGVGDFKEVKLMGADGLIGARAGQTAGFYIKLMELAPDLSSFKLYQTSIARLTAYCKVAVCDALPAGGPNENKLEKYLADNLPTFIAADYAPLESRVVDEDTYVQQGRDLEATFINAVTKYILGTLQPDTDLALVGYTTVDEFQHQFLGLVTPQDIDDQPNPCFDDTYCTSTPEGRLEIREGYLRSAYQGADSMLALSRKLMGGNPSTFATSDHGFGVQWYAVNAQKVLVDAGLMSAEASSCRIPTGDGAFAKAKACVTGGSAGVYINPALVTSANYEATRDAIIAAFQSLDALEGKQVVLKIMKKEELKNVDGSDSLHPSRSPDVMVVLRPPYQFDAPTKGKTIALSQFFGQHGYMPELVDIPHNINMHAVFVASGPGIKWTPFMQGVRAIDVAPTVAMLMNIPGPVNARGKILLDIFPLSFFYKEATVLSLSDFHGQITPLSEAADNLTTTGSTNASFGIGGAAYLKPWLDAYREEAASQARPGAVSSILVTAGDAVGATPPISNFFGDKPTMTVLNMLGVSADTLGNHNFDRGSAYLRNELIPLAEFPYLASNVVFQDTGKFPAEWKASTVFNVNGIRLGVVGYTLPDLKDLIFPGYLDPFKVTDPVKTVNTAAMSLHAKGADAVVAVGHLGVDLDQNKVVLPSSPLITFANSLKNVDVAIGGHTHTQYVGTSPNGKVLVSENQNAGTRFTRTRIVVNTLTDKVVYKTADWHKVWNIGVTPDPDIQAQINDLNALLAPILNTVIGSSNRYIPRSDSCGRGDGRLCESLIGDVAADALRATYNTDFAITNSGGLRADLTCPTSDIAGDFCPAYTPPPYPITRGSSLAVLPFGNVVFTATVSGAELKSMLENGVSLMPSAQGRFPQVSGLCFTYDISAAAGSRVTSAVRQAADGTCTGAAIDLTAAASYKIAENDFMATGGDGYPNIYNRGTTQNIMDQVVADWITANSPLNPAIQGRVVCTTSGSVACPVITAP